jgi:integrase
VPRGLLASSPCDGQDLPESKRQEMRFLDSPQVAVLAGTMDARYRPLVLLAAYGGLRAGELFALRRHRLDLLRGKVDVAETVVEVRGELHVGPPKTDAGKRSVALRRSVVDVLTEHTAGLEDDDLVFPAPSGGMIRASLWRRRFWYPATIAAGFGNMVKDDEGGQHYEGLRLHDLRHTAVALWIAAGASPKEIAVRAGHTSVSVVLDRYGHRLPGTEEKVTDALDAMARAASSTTAVVRAIR